MTSTGEALIRIRDSAAALIRAEAALSSEAAAHAHLAAATGSTSGSSPKYLALAPRRIEAVFLGAEVQVPGIIADRGAVAEVVRARPDLFTTKVTFADGTQVPVLTREALMAQLLVEGGLSVGLCGLVLRLAGTPPVDIDEVREVLKAARCGDRFQPLLELVSVV